MPSGTGRAGWRCRSGPAARGHFRRSSWYDCGAGVNSDRMNNAPLARDLPPRHGMAREPNNTTVLGSHHRFWRTGMMRSEGGPPLILERGEEVQTLPA